jgi:hypothetical protein
LWRIIRWEKEATSSLTQGVIAKRSEVLTPCLDYVIEKILSDTLKHRTNDVIDMRCSTSSVGCYIIEDIVDVIVIGVEQREGILAIEVATVKKCGKNSTCLHRECA